ncbi:MAG: hypothetical protein KGJ02_07555 [Verrucomicrobiota bacterium]|nr:hypothetical protein [Verrucomicrobiota bacterium]
MKTSIFSIVFGTATLVSSFATAANAASGNHLFYSQKAIEENLKMYNDSEKAALQKDLENVRKSWFSEVRDSLPKPLYLASAGAPGSAKTSIMERFMQDNGLTTKTVYIDPDQRALKLLTNTYQAELKRIVNSPSEIKNAYDKWKGGSKYITLTLLEEAFTQKKSIAHGADLTTDDTAKFLSKVKDAGYDIMLLLCSADDEFRQKTIQFKNDVEQFFNINPTDEVNKSKYFTQQMPTYFTYANTLYLYWSNELGTSEHVAAILQNGNVQVVNMDAMNHFVQKYEADRAVLAKEGKKIPAWDELVRTYQKRF